MLRASLAVISDWIRFQKNHAYRGAALKITDGSRVSRPDVHMYLHYIYCVMDLILLQVDATAVTEARFIENSAEYKGGAIYADEKSASLSVNEYTHLFAQLLPGNCFISFGNEQTSTAGNSLVCVIQ